jgi:hypothetical protein
MCYKVIVVFAADFLSCGRTMGEGRSISSREHTSASARRVAVPGRFGAVRYPVARRRFGAIGCESISSV